MKSTSEVKYVNVDIIDLVDVDLVWDLNVIPYPFNDNSIDKIIMNDILEHLDFPINVIKECYRLLKSNSVLFIKLPYFSHRNAWGDPQHKHAFSEVYFEHFLKRHPRNYSYDFYFDTLEVKFIYQIEPIIKGMEIILIK